MIQDRLKYLRKELLRLTQEQFAANISLSRSAYTNMENGVTGMSSRTLRDISRVYSVNELWLQTGEGEVFNSLSEQLQSQVIKVFQQLGPNYQTCAIRQMEQLILVQEAETQPPAP